MEAGDPVPRGTRKPPNAGKGRRKGSVNKATADVRAAVAEIAKNNIGNVQSWLTRVAKKQPHRALQLYLELIEYHIPKLSRTEMTGKDGKDLTVVVAQQGDAGL